MTRQMTDDEVLRRYDSLINGCSDRYCPECQRLREMRNYVAALQAERDADKAALEALRGQVAGLVEGWRKVAVKQHLRAAAAEADRDAEDVSRWKALAERSEYCADELAALLAIKEGMG